MTYARCIARAALSSLAVVLTSACGSQAHDESAPPALKVAECDAYAAAFGACMVRVDPASAEQRRTALAEGLQRRDLRDPSAREALRAQCTAGLARLKTACP